MVSDAVDNRLVLNDSMNSDGLDDLLGHWNGFDNLLLDHDDDFLVGVLRLAFNSHDLWLEFGALRIHMDRKFLLPVAWKRLLDLVEADESLEGGTFIRTGTSHGSARLRPRRLTRIVESNKLVLLQLSEGFMSDGQAVELLIGFLWPIFLAVRIGPQAEDLSLLLFSERLVLRGQAVQSLIRKPWLICPNNRHLEVVVQSFLRLRDGFVAHSKADQWLIWEVRLEPFGRLCANRSRRLILGSRAITERSFTSLSEWLVVDGKAVLTNVR